MAVIDRLQLWAQRADERPLRRLPPEELVIISERQHPAVLILPVIRTGSGVGMMICRPTFGLLLLFAGAVLAATIRSPARLRRRHVLVLVVLLGVAVFLLGHAGGPAIRALTSVALLLWLLGDVLGWFYDRLVVTNRRLYRVYGVVTTHRPSVALQQVYVADLTLGPAARWFGTLSFDTPAQHDAPFHRFTYIRQAAAVHGTILQLRTTATSQSPQPGP